MVTAMLKKPLWRTALLGTLMLSWTQASAAGACVVTPAELEAATGRAFQAGEETKTAGGAPLCVYAEQARPKRKVTVEIVDTQAGKRFDSQLRLLQFGNKSIEVAGVGDRAYFNGTAAGVLQGDRLIAFSQLRRSSDPKIPEDKVVTLLQAAID